MKRIKRKKLISWFILAAFLLGCLPVAAFGAEAADSVYINGNIYTVDENNPTVAAIAIKDGLISYVGTVEGAQEYIGNATDVVDLKGMTVIPGIVEGHAHVGNLGQSLLIIDAFWKPKAEILAAVKEEAGRAEPGEWIQGRGWLNTLWNDDAYPSKEELDAVAPDNPVILTRADGHMCWVNSMALEMAGITKDTPDPQGGEILKTSDGEVLGCLTDTAMNPVRELVPDLSVERQREAILAAQAQMFSYGITSTMDAGASVTQLSNFAALYESGQLKLKIYPLIMITEMDSPEMEYVKNNPPAGMLYDNRYTIKAVKMMGDGSLGARSAAMLEDYSDRHDHIGNYRYTDEEVYELMKTVYDSGYQIGYHAIGDGANHQAIETFARIMEENPREDPRLRIEHFQILTQEDITRAIGLDILPSMQPTHATSDLLMAEDRIGPERIKGAYAWKTILNQGSIIIGGSDAPVELVNPYHGLYAAVTRKTRAGEPDGGWYPNEKMTREEALKSFTIWAAYGQFEEDLKGSLEVGKLADFVVLDRDYMTCPEDDIKDIAAVLTVSSGEVVYKRENDVATVMWQGLPITFSDRIVKENNTIYASAERMADTIGAELTFDEAGVTVALNGKTATLETLQVSGSSYVSVRQLFEGLGFKVNWYQDSACISIS